MRILNTKLTLCIFLFIPALLNAQAFLDLETGVVFTGYNDVRIPGDKGTLFSLKDDLKPDPAFFYRLSLGYTFKSRHNVTLLHAPLQVRSEGRAPHAILFEGVPFPASEVLTASYKFNSYRLTYRYDIIEKENFEFGLGLTGKIRDAKIELAVKEGPEKPIAKTNVGFVPLINFRFAWNMNDKFGLLIHGDALAASQGRAEDVLIAATCKLSEKLRLRAGYRILEGGADNDEVYNFSLFSYVSAGVTYTFAKGQN